MKNHVYLKLFATLSNIIPNGQNTVSITPGMTIKDLIQKIGIPTEKIKLIFVNGRIKQANTTLHGEEKISIFPSVGGG